MGVSNDFFSVMMVLLWLLCLLESAFEKERRGIYHFGGQLWMSTFLFAKSEDN